LSKIDEQTFSNQQKFKDITGILYFAEDDTSSNLNFLNDNNNEELSFLDNNVSIDTNKNMNDKYLQLNDKVKEYFDTEKFGLNGKFVSITNSILGALHYSNNNSKQLFFEKMIKDFNVFKLFSKFKYKTKIKKKDFYNKLIELKEDDDIIRQFISDYLNINLIIFSNDEIKTYCKTEEYDIYRVSVLLYYHNEIYSYLNDKETGKSLFTSDSEINYKLDSLFEREEETDSDEEDNEMEELPDIKEDDFVEVKSDSDCHEIDTEEDVKVDEIIDVEQIVKDYKKMKINDLIDECKRKKLDYLKPTKNGKNKKKKTKKELIELLEKS
jgi:hypothetical protein